MFLCHLTNALLCQINTLINLYMSATALIENSWYYGLSLQNKKDCFSNQLFGCPKPNFDVKWYTKQKNYMLKMILLHPILATNARVVFKLSSLLITTLTCHQSKTWYIYEYNIIYLTQATNNTSSCSNEKLNS